MGKVIKDLKQSAYVQETFSDAKRALEREGYCLISLEKNVLLRLESGPGAFVSANGNRTCEGLIVLPDGTNYLSRHSPILQNAEEALKCHKKGSEFYLNQKQLDEVLGDAVKVSNRTLLTDRLAEYAESRFMFKDHAAHYGAFLSENGVKELAIWTCDPDTKPYVRQIWFRGLNEKSVINTMNLNTYTLVRGIMNHN